MPRKGLVVTAITIMVVFMLASTVIAVAQEDLDWGWWWAVPASGVFFALMLAFRFMVHLSAEAADRADREADMLEASQNGHLDAGDQEIDSTTHS